MLRKLVITLAATAAIGTAAIPISTSALGPLWLACGGGWHGGGGAVAGMAAGTVAGADRMGLLPLRIRTESYYGGCCRKVRVGTPYGWRWRRVWVCG